MLLALSPQIVIAPLLYHFTSLSIITEMGAIKFCFYATLGFNSNDFIISSYNKCQLLPSEKCLSMTKISIRPHIYRIHSQSDYQTNSYRSTFRWGDNYLTGVVIFLICNINTFLNGN